MAEWWEAAALGTDHVSAHSRARLFEFPSEPSWTDEREPTDSHHVHFYLRLEGKCDPTVDGQKSRCWGWYCGGYCCTAPPAPRELWSEVGTPPVHPLRDRASNWHLPRQRKSSGYKLHKLQQVFFSFNPLSFWAWSWKGQKQHLEHKEEKEGTALKEKNQSCISPQSGPCLGGKRQEEGKREVNQSFVLRENFKISNWRLFCDYKQTRDFFSEWLKKFGT